MAGKLWNCFISKASDTVIRTVPTVNERNLCPKDQLFYRVTVLQKEGISSERLTEELS